MIMFKATSLSSSLRLAQYNSLVALQPHPGSKQKQREVVVSPGLPGDLTQDYYIAHFSDGSEIPAYDLSWEHHETKLPSHHLYEIDLQSFQTTRWPRGSERLEFFIAVN